MFNFTQTLTALLLVGACTASHAAEYWISKKGSDANNCSSASLSCLSIQKGLNILKPGDILNIDEGTYIEDSTNSTLTSKCGLLDANYGSLCIKSSGTAENPITIRALPGKEGKVIIDSEGKRAGIIISKHDYIHIQNLILRNSWTGGIATPGGPASTTAAPSDDILSIGCEIVGNTIENTRGAWGVNTSAIYMWSTKNWIVRDNIIKTVKSDPTWEVNGIQTYGTINAIIEHNDILDVDVGINWKDHYIMSGSYQESTIKYNFLSVAKTGIRISIRADKSNPAGDNQIENNIIELINESSVGVAAYLAGANGMSRELTVKNNLFIGRNLKHVAINADALKSLRVIGNIFSNMETAVSLRLQDTSRPARLTESNFNVFDMAFQILHDRYDPSGDSETYKQLGQWQQVKPSADATLLSLAIDNPDGSSIQYDSSRIRTTLIAEDDFRSQMPPPITNTKGEHYQPGPYQNTNDIVGARKNIISAPLAPEKPKSQQL